MLSVVVLRTYAKKMCRLQLKWTLKQSANNSTGTPSPPHCVKVDCLVMC